MSFSTRQITHAFENADGTPASGSVTFSLSKRITNGSTTIVPAEITTSLDPTGNLSQTLTANNDVGTIPQDSQWRVDFRLATPGAPVTETFWIVVPAGSGAIDLGSLLPQQPIGG